MSKCFNTFVRTRNKTLQGYTLLDSGASHHIFSDQSRFTRLQAAHGSPAVEAGGGQVPMTGYGTVALETLDEKGRRRILTLENAILCPGFICNLVSVSELAKRGLYWDLKTPNCCIRRANGIFLCQVIPQHGLYYLDNQIQHTENYTGFVAACHARKSTDPRPPKWC